MIFKGGILGGAQKFHLDSYLNSTTIPFDVHAICKPEAFFLGSNKTRNTEQRNNGISENYILNILLLYIQSIAFIQYLPRSNSTENH